VNSNKRLAYLERFFAEEPELVNVPPSFTIRLEAERWGRVLQERIAPLLTVNQVEAVFEFLRFQWRDFLLPGVTPRGPGHDRWNDPLDYAGQARRFPVVVALVLARAPADLRPAVVAALDTPGGPREGAKARDPLRHWLWGLARLATRLPSDVSDECVDGVLRILVERWDECNEMGGGTCSGCGLERPQMAHPIQGPVLPGRTAFQGPPPWFSYTDFYKGCPHCGCSEYVPSCRSREECFAWRELARNELDPDAVEESLRD
jgi:hypothetical protein